MKAKMKSYGYELQSEKSTYNLITSDSEFKFIRKYVEKVTIGHNTYAVDRIIEFKFQTSNDRTFIYSRIDFICESSKPKYFFIDKLINIWLAEISDNRTIDTEARFNIEKKLIIIDNSPTCGKPANDNVIISCHRPSKDYRIFLEKGNEYYSKFHGFMIHTQPLNPVENSLFLDE